VGSVSLCNIAETFANFGAPLCKTLWPNFLRINPHSFSFLYFSSLNRDFQFILKAFQLKQLLGVGG
jgi:hypothetical protein